jgi:hypothetical protein
MGIAVRGSGLMIAKESSEIAVAIPDGRLDSEGFLKGLYRVANTFRTDT